MPKWWKNFYENNFAAFFLERGAVTNKKIAKFLIKTLRLKKGALVFDQCCGIGGIAHALSRTGINIIGVDQSREYIKKASLVAKKEKLPCHFFWGNAFTFANKTKCDAAFNWYTSFGYSRDDNENIKMLERVYRSLKRGGYFVLDYHNTIAMIQNFNETKQIIKQFDDKKAIITRKSKIDAENGMLFSLWTYKLPGKSKKSFGGETRLYLPSDIKILLLKTGFKNIKFYGNINGSRFNAKSARCITVAQKP